jgi:formylglycine-generating enzyme required for sulfatase activity
MGTGPLLGLGWLPSSHLCRRNSSKAIEGDETSPRLVRGDSWLNLPRVCGSAHRDGDDPNYWYNNVGFRLVCAVRNAAFA